jgi:hypothetical protein
MIARRRALLYPVPLFDSATCASRNCLVRVADQWELEIF